MDANVVIVRASVFFVAVLAALVTPNASRASHVNPSKPIIRVNPATGASEIVSIGGELDLAFDMEVRSDGTIVAESQAHGIVAIDPIDGTQTVLFPDSAFEGNVFRVAIDALDHIYLSELHSAFTGDRTSILLANPISGTLEPQVEVPSRMWALEARTTGELLFSTDVSGTLWAYDPGSDSIRTVSSGGLLQGLLFGLAVSPSDEVFVTVHGSSQSIIAIDPVSGSQRFVRNRDEVHSLAFDRNGNLFGIGQSQVFQIDPLSGVRTEITLEAPGTWDFNGFSALAVDANGDLLIATGGTSIPEPSTAVLFAFGLAALARRRRPLPV